jgi:hypothetical protein
MFEPFQGSGILGFSDPAGAKACLGLAALLRAEQPGITLSLLSNKQYDFYADWDIPVQVAESFDLSAVMAGADWLFTGTSHPASSGGFELKLIRQARSMGIPSYAFVDHYTSFSLRFILDAEPVLPDHVLVLDEQARTNALTDGLDASLLQLMPNPYLSYISRLYCPGLDLQEVRDRLGITNSKARLVLYAPDPISLRNENGAWTFDELSTLDDLLTILNDCPGTFLAIKAHPLQPMAGLQCRLDAARAANHTTVVLAEGLPNLDLMLAADVVVGMQSNFLMEAHALGRPVLRYFPASAEQDALQHLEIGKKICSPDQLQQALQHILTHYGSNSIPGRGTHHTAAPGTN